MSEPSFGRIARWAAGLALSISAAASLYRYAALPDHEAGALFLAVGFAVAVWFAYRSWRTVFAGLAARLNWGPRTCWAMAALILAAGFLLRFYMGQGLAMLVCLAAALGCFPSNAWRTASK